MWYPHQAAFGVGHTREGGVILAPRPPPKRHPTQAAKAWVSHSPARIWSWAVWYGLRVSEPARRAVVAGGFLPRQAARYSAKAVAPWGSRAGVFSATRRSLGAVAALAPRAGLPTSTGTIAPRVGDCARLPASSSTVSRLIRSSQALVEGT